MALKVFDLQCASGHVFEGWFAGADSFETQQAGGLLVCPVCNSKSISKKLSAPRINRGQSNNVEAEAPRQAAAAPAPAPDSDLGRLQQLQAQIISHMRKVVKNSENVGERFATEARRMHEGETEERPIRGTATAEERQQLLEEGIDVQPIPDFLDDDRLQ